MWHRGTQCKGVPTKESNGPIEGDIADIFGVPLEEATHKQTKEPIGEQAWPQPKEVLEE